MDKEQERLIERIKAVPTDDYGYCIQTISKLLRDNYKHTHSEDFVTSFNQVMTDKFPDRANDYDQMIADVTMQDDAEFVKRINAITAIDPVRANFEMSLYIRRMEDDFDQFTPKKNIQNLSIYDELDLFQFIYHNESGTELLPTVRDYAGMYIEFAKVQIQANEWREAIESYQQALLWNPYDVETIYALAELFQEMEQYGMSYPTILNGLSYSLRVEDLAYGFALIGDFYYRKEDYDKAYMLYNISLMWDDNDVASEGLEILEELDREWPEVLEGKEQEAFLEELGLNEYPSIDMLTALKEAAIRFYQNDQYEAAYEYFAIYEDILGNVDPEVSDILDKIETEHPDVLMEDFDAHDHSHHDHDHDHHDHNHDHHHHHH
ncbi:hypothetical protein EF384_07150 [Aerococcus agrisoli]|uniref:BUB1 N-terminal domain-containing protein n=1 Tax=Aerococcus agrisoli TaxID=2487350 RepID=A0A3N4GHQ8_9LACT|nr:hypothetical protein [Aerococcus agrisoli]RPA58661.1 hypothetical protein EF384_07150 [Aerococcus agrisoli]